MSTQIIVYKFAAFSVFSITNYQLIYSFYYLRHLGSYVTCSLDDVSGEYKQVGIIKMFYFKNEIELAVFYRTEYHNRCTSAFCSLVVKEFKWCSKDPEFEYKYSRGQQIFLEKSLFKCLLRRKHFFSNFLWFVFGKYTRFGWIVNEHFSVSRVNHKNWYSDSVLFGRTGLNFFYRFKTFFYRPH